MCLFLILLFLGPRTAIFFWWLTTPERWERAYDSFLVPFLGLLFLPWTTLAYVVVAPAGVLRGFDYVVLGIALLIDVGSSSSSSDRARRRRSRR